MVEDVGKYQVAVRPDGGEEYNFHDLVKHDGLSLQLKKQLTWDEATYAGNVLRFMHEQVQFAIGDFMIACVGLFGEKAYQLPIFNYSESRLRTWKQIAERIKPEGRREDLEFSYHEEVAYIDPIYHDEWLDRTKSEQWTVKELHEELIKAGLKEPRKQKEQKECPGCQTYRAILTELANPSGDLEWVAGLANRALAEV